MKLEKGKRQGRHENVRDYLCPAGTGKTTCIPFFGGRKERENALLIDIDQSSQVLRIRRDQGGRAGDRTVVGRILISCRSGSIWQSGSRP